MGVPMTDAEFDVEDYDDDYEEEELGPSLAMPPLYVLRTTDCCPECGKAQHVYTLGCAAFHDAQDRHPIEEFHFLHTIRSVPEPVLDLLKAKSPGYYLDHTEERETPYLMNHCDCGARIDDDYLHGDVGAAFWPDTPEGYRRFKLFRIRIDDPIPVECSYTLGGGKYLNVAGAAMW
jgi:hypothetical protein